MADVSASQHPDSGNLPAWMPTNGSGVKILSCGTDFDAVRVPGHIGAYALELLAGRSGPVIEAVKDGVLYWLVQAGRASDWRLRSVVVYRGACYVAVPAADWDGGRGLRWLVGPAGDCLTDPEALHDALAAAVERQLGPLRTAG